MTLDDLLNQIHRDHPNLVYSIIKKDGVIVFFDQNGLPRSTLTLTQGPFGSIGVDYFDFDHKLYSENL